MNSLRAGVCAGLHSLRLAHGWPVDVARWFVCGNRGSPHWM